MFVFKKYTILTFALLLLPGNCGKSTKDSRYLVAFSQFNTVEPMRNAINNSILDEAKKYSNLLKLEFTDADQDPVKQETDIENFLEAEVDLLIVALKGDNSLKEVMKKVFDSGIPIIIIDQMPDNEYYTCFIGVNNIQIGKEAGKYAVEILNGEGNIVEIRGLPGLNSSDERSSGFKEIIDNYPDMKIVYSDFANWMIPLAITKMEMALREQDKIDLVFAHNDQMAVGAYLASRSHRRENRIVFIGVGGLSSEGLGLQALDDGKINATFLYPTYGKETLEYALKILNKKNVPKTVKLNTRLITKEKNEF